MFSTTDFKRGLKIEIDGTPYEIVEFQHFKPGKGGAMVRTKLRNILNGRIVDNTFRSGEKVGRPDLELEADFCGGKERYLKEAQQVLVLLYNGKPIDIEIPLSLILEVIETEEVAKGDTVNNITKPAKLETGVVIQVPAFVKVGDKVKVNTENDEYLGRE